MATQTPKRPEDDLHGEDRVDPLFGPDRENPGVYGNEADFQKIVSRMHDDESSNDTPDQGDLRSREDAAAGGAAGALDRGEQSFADRLKAAEAKGSFLKPDSEEKGFAKFRARISRFSRRRVATIAIIGLLGGGGIYGVSILQGPFQIVHMAQLLTGAHFGNQEDASDGRVGKLYRYLRSGNDVGETRLSYLSSKQKTRMLADLEKMGLKPDYGAAKTYRGFTIDTDNRKSPFYNMSEDEIRDKLSRGGVKSGVTKDGSVMKVSVEGYFSQRASSRVLAKEMGYGKITAPMRARALDRYGLVTWHPLKKLDKKVNQSVADRYKQWKEDRDERLKNGVKGTTIDPTNATETETDSNGKTTSTNVGGPVETPDQSRIGSILNDVKGSSTLKVTGGVGAAAGVVCSAQAVNENISEIRFLQVVRPMIRIAMDIITSGYQIMSGQDTAMETAGFVAKDFNEKDSGGKVISTINQSKAYKAETGQTGGTDIDDATKEMITEGSPSWLSWTNDPSVGALCSTGGQIITGAVSVTIGVLSGGTVSVVGGVVAGAVAGPVVINKIAKVLSGNAVDVSKQGVERGNYYQYGARMGANSASLLAGGAKLSKSQENQLDAMRRTDENVEFSKQPFFARIFSLNDRRTVASTIVDNAPAVNSQTASMLIQNSTQTLMGVFKMPVSVFSKKANAASSNYDYGFPEYGFSANDLDDERVGDPYDNADKVATLLNTKPDYISKANECFGVNIEKDSTGWAVRADPEANGGLGVNVYDEKYDSDGCLGQGNLEWTRIRFFIFDTGVMNGLACYQGDDESCAELGIANETASSDSAATESAGDGNCNGGEDRGMQDAYVNGSKTSKKICAMAAGNGTTIEVSADISKNISDLLAAAKKDGIDFTGYGFRSMQKQQELYDAYKSGTGAEAAKPGYSNHQGGVAIDFGLGGASICYGLPASSCHGNRGFDWLKANASKFGLKNYPAEAWHWSTTGN